MTDIAGYRRAVVELQALGEDDRHWILEALRQDERTCLIQCLEEFKALGFSAAAMPELAASLADMPAKPGASQSAPYSASYRASPYASRSVQPTPLECLLVASAAEMSVMLRDEPVSLIARLIKVREWPWAPTYLSALSTGQRSRLEAAMACSTAAPAFGNFLVETIGKRMPGQKHALSAGGIQTPAKMPAWLRREAMRRLASLAGIFYKKRVTSWKR